MQRHTQVVAEAIVLDTGGAQRHTQVVSEAIVLNYDGEIRITQVVGEAIVLGFGELRATHEYLQYGLQQDSFARSTFEDAQYALHQESAVHVTHEYFQYSLNQPSAVRVTHLYLQVALKPTGRPDTLPDLLGICNMRNVIRAGEEESGIAASPKTWQTAANEVFGYRRQLLQRLRMRYFDAEDAINVVDIPQGEVGDTTIVLPAMLSMETFEVRLIGTEEWLPIRPVEAFDRASETRPAFLLRGTEATLLHYDEDWIGVYDQLRIRGVDNPVDDEDWDLDTLVPNELLGPLFCTCLKLEAARILCLREPVMGGTLRAAYILAERLRVERDLFTQGASMNRHLASRSTPSPHRPQ